MRERVGKRVGSGLGAAIGNRMAYAAREATNRLGGGASFVGDVTRDVVRPSEIRSTFTATGGWLGGKIACGLTAQDQARLATSTKLTAKTGMPSSWNNQETGYRGRAEVTATTREVASYQIPVVKEKVVQVPPLELIGDTYRADVNLKVHGGAGTTHPVVGSVKKGELIQVTGKVQNQPWYMISKDGVGSGFVPVKGMTHQPGVEIAATEVAVIEGTIEDRPVEVARTCRTVKQTVSKDGVDTVENVTACQGANGWELG